MEVDIFIDEITDCLIDTRTGGEVGMEYRMPTKDISEVGEVKE